MKSIANFDSFWSRDDSEVYRQSSAKKVSRGVGDGCVYDCRGKYQWLKFFRRNYKIEDTEPIENRVSSFTRETSVLKVEIIAATISSLISTAVSHPFDVIKSYFQSVRCPRCTTFHSRHHRSMYFVAQHILRTKGYQRFFRGHMVHQYESLIHSIAMFWTYNFANRALNNINDLKDYPYTKSFTAGFISATIPVLVLHPLNKIVIRRKKFEKACQMYHRSCQTFLGRLKYFPSVLCGSYSLFMHLGFLYGFRFAFFHGIIDDMESKNPTNDKATNTNVGVSEVDSIVRLTKYQLLAAGAMAAILGDILTYPLDIVHVRLNMPTLQRQLYPFERTCYKYCQCFRTIIKHEGFSAFYAGLISSLFKSSIDTAIQFAVYFNVKYILRSFITT